MSNDALIRRIKYLEKLVKSNNVFIGRINDQDSGAAKWPWINRRSSAAARVITNQQKTVQQQSDHWPTKLASLELKF